MPSINVAKRLGLGRLAGVGVVRGETRIGVERRVNGVVREVEEERLAGLHGVADARVGFEGQRLGEETSRCRGTSPDAARPAEARGVPCP